MTGVFVCVSGGIVMVERVGVKQVVCVLGEEEDGGVCLENKMNGVGFRCLLKIEKR